jgi:hypothetical protein
VCDPPSMPVLATALATEYAGIPGPRASCDTFVNPAAANFLRSLRSVGSVVLNGRAAGDDTGACTYYALDAAGHMMGQSVVDLGIVSNSLFAGEMF